MAYRSRSRRRGSYRGRSRRIIRRRRARPLRIGFRM